MKIKKNGVYGTFKAIKKLDNDKFGCICISCDAKKKFSTERLAENPECSCTKQIVISSDDKDLREIFGEDSQSIIDLLAHDDKAKGIDKFNLSTLKSTLQNIRIANKQYKERPGQSNAYALNSFVSQARELIADIQAAQESNDLHIRIATEVFLPEYNNIGQTMVNQIYTLKTKINHYVDDDKARKVEKVIDEMAVEIARSMDLSFRSVQEKLQTFLE